MTKEVYKQKEKYSGKFKGEDITFNREWAGHRFTDAECEALLNGKEIIIEAVSKKGKKFSVAGKLGENSFNDRIFYSFIPDFDKHILPISFCGYEFTNEEREELEKGQSVFCTGLVGKSGKEFDAHVTFNTKKGIELKFE